MGCTAKPWPPTEMYGPVNVPTESARIHPWIAELLVADVSAARRLVNARLECPLPAMIPLVQSMHDFVPVQIVFSSNHGYVRCVRRFAEPTTQEAAYETIYIAQPLSDAATELRVNYFDRDVQPLAREFFKRFAGSGEEMEGTAGQFSFHHWVDAAAFSSEDRNSLGAWREAKLFYAAMNGDSVFIQPNGATAWHTFETDKMTPIVDSLEEFIQLYADFRKTHEIFDSWYYRQFLSSKSKR